MRYLVSRDMNAVLERTLHKYGAGTRERGLRYVEMTGGNCRQGWVGPRGTSLISWWG